MKQLGLIGTSHEADSDPDGCPSNEELCGHLERILIACEDDPNCVYCATDATLPEQRLYQAVSAALVFHDGKPVHECRFVAGRVTAPDAELFAIRVAITAALRQPDCERIVVFTHQSTLAKDTPWLCVAPWPHGSKSHLTAKSSSFKSFHDFNGTFIKQLTTSVMIYPQFEVETLKHLWIVSARMLPTELDGTPKQPSYINGGAASPIMPRLGTILPNSISQNWLDAATVPPTSEAANTSWNGAINKSTTPVTANLMYQSMYINIEDNQKIHFKAISDDPVKMWAALKAVHLQKCSGNCFNVYDDLFSIRKKDNESLQAFINRVDDSIQAIQDLHPADFNLKKLDDELTSMAMIRALPEEYSTFASSLLLLDKLDKASIQSAFFTEGIQYRHRAGEAPNVGSAQMHFLWHI
ncbi:hypothetical protein BDN70DRAFT_939614 [Pholiota conissans]|uniref:Uncharacterized protein n=1 Tax=Pholiota conissans TaxID=109636 RepID=A0A9P6CSF7_9AGAR|nr:hypothetical protein BDN70DRAFT_939614 [Pholiota conissans]